MQHNPDWKSRIQRDWIFCWHWSVPRTSSSLHMNHRKTIFAAKPLGWSLGENFLQGYDGHLGPPLCMERSAGTIHMASPLPHRGRDTRVCIIPASHRASLYLLASQLCPSYSCLCPPYPYICPLHLKWKWSSLTEHHTSPSNDTGQNGIVPSVKSECFISGSIFALLMCDGEGRWGDHCVAALARGRRYFSRSGSSSQLPCSRERKQHAWKCSCEAQCKISLRLKSRFTPIEKTILPAWAHDTVISLWTLILADSLGTACYFHCSWVVRYFTSLFIKNQEGSILQWNEENNSSFNLTCIYFMRGPSEMTDTIFIFIHKDILCKGKNSGLHFLFLFSLSWKSCFQLLTQAVRISLH